MKQHRAQLMFEEVEDTGEFTFHPRLIVCGQNEWKDLFQLLASNSE